MIKWTYYNPFWKEYTFEIEDWVLTNEPMEDDFDAFWEEMEAVFNN